MPYEINWYLPKRIIYHKVTHILTNDEVHTASTLFKDYLTQGIAPIHIIIDATELEEFPQNIHFSKSHDPFTHQNTGWVILMGGDKMAQFITSVAAKVSGLSFKSVDTLQMALTFLQQQDTTLNAANGC